MIMHDRKGRLAMDRVMTPEWAAKIKKPTRLSFAFSAEELEVLMNHAQLQMADELITFVFENQHQEKTLAVIQENEELREDLTAQVRAVMMMTLFDNAEKIMDECMARARDSV